MQRLAIVLLSIPCLFGSAPRAGEVRVWEEPLVIPTYEIGPADPNPRFYAGRSHQGAQGRVYPYPMLDTLTDRKVDKTYKALYLENQYVKLCVLPELGGRLFSAVDKTNGYDFFYRQHVIKPVLIGMLGAWISGGIEWNVPHHHRATTFMPVDSCLKENRDGSATIWVGELEIRHRMRWAIGLTLRPDRSTIELTGRIYNRTPFVNSILYFANPAVHANENYQVIFPPSTEYVTQHAKREFLDWPIANGRYGGHLYEDVDISWYKNLPKPVSFFAWDDTDEFFGGYDHGKDAGVVHVANHHTVPGKKFWTFACGPQGRMWDTMLTDGDGPYIELMAGAYSDNQPDYSWIQPYEVKTWKQYWYPVRGIGGFTYANLDGAVNLTVGGGVAKLRIHTPAAREDARVVLEAKGKIVLDERAAVAPDRPFARDVALAEGTAETDVRVALRDGDGREILAYRPAKRAGAPMPPSVEPPPAPEKIATVEELYLTGLRIEQFHHASLDPLAYYGEALRRDPGDSRANTRMGIWYARRGEYARAREHLSKAVERLTRNYTRPIDGEPHYYLGVACRGLGDLDAAYDALSRATWNIAWTAAGYYALAEIDMRRGDIERCLEHLRRSLDHNAQNASALSLMSAALRRMGDLDGAEKAAARAAEIDPLDAWSRAAQALLERSASYANAGLWEEATGVLERIAGQPGAGEDPAGANPMVWYHLAWLWQCRGDEEKAAAAFRQARSLSPELSFPFRLESIGVLEAAIRRAPDDARAHYLLGNLLFDLQPERAIRCWEKARELDPGFARVHRNLAFGYAYAKGDPAMAIARLERAIELDPSDPRFLFEIDLLFEAAKVSLPARLALFEKRVETVRKRDDATWRLCALYVQTGRYDEAIEILRSHHFHTWEGGGEIHDVFVDAYLLRGLEKLRQGDAEGALADFDASFEYPRNLEIGHPLSDPAEARAHLLRAFAYRRLGDPVKEKEAYERAAAIDAGSGEFLVYRGLALRALGRTEEAAKVLDALIERGRRDLESTGTRDFFEKFGERLSHENALARAHFLIGLGHAGRDEFDEAEKAFRKVLELDPTHVWAMESLRQMRRG